MGLPLAQVKQQFSTMDLNGQELKNMMVEKIDKYQVGSIIGARFIMQQGYTLKFCT